MLMKRALLLTSLGRLRIQESKDRYEALTRQVRSNINAPLQKAKISHARVDKWSASIQPRALPRSSPRLRLLGCFILSIIPSAQSLLLGSSRYQRCLCEAPFKSVIGSRFRSMCYSHVFTVAPTAASCRCGIGSDTATMQIGTEP